LCAGVNSKKYLTHNLNNYQRPCPTGGTVGLQIIPHPLQLAPWERWGHVPKAHGVKCHTHAAQKAPEGDDRQTDTQTYDPSIR